MLHPPQHLHLIMRTRCACPEICCSPPRATESVLDLATDRRATISALRLPRNLHLTLRKCCAWHAHQCRREKRTHRLCKITSIAVRAPSATRRGLHVSDIPVPLPHVHGCSACASSSLVFCHRFSFQLVAVPRKFLLSFLSLFRPHSRLKLHSNLGRTRYRSPLKAISRKGPLPALTQTNT